MAWVEILWKLEVIDENESSPDESELQFVLITAVGGRLHYRTHSTGNVRDVGGPGNIINPRDRYWGRIQWDIPVPTAEDPYVGLVIRGIERDNSSGSQRVRDLSRFEEAIEQTANEQMSFGSPPAPGVLWLAANRPKLEDDFGDDDDLVGVSARARLDWGERLSAVDESTLERGTVYLSPPDEVRLRGRDEGDYSVVFSLRARAGRRGADLFPTSMEFSEPPEDFAAG